MSQTKKIYKFVFLAKLQTISLALKFPCVVSVTWKRGQKSAQVKQRKEIQNGIVNFNQTLELECNMNFDQSTRKFEEKKTRFTVLIFSEKGNKQAGEINLDVAEFLNAKLKQLKVQRSLQKCPDKNAKMIFTLSGYMKQQISSDAVSQKSTGTLSVEPSTMTASLIQQPDFKKKKNDVSSAQLPPKPQQPKRDEIQQRRNQQRIPTVNKQNKQKIKLQQENRTLRQQLHELRQLQTENNALKRRYEQGQKKSLSYYNKKFEQMKKEYEDAKNKAKKVQELVIKKLDMERQMCECKQKMGQILNFAIMNGNTDMTEEIYNIYQNSRPCAN